MLLRSTKWSKKLTLVFFLGLAQIWFINWKHYCNIIYVCALGTYCSVSFLFSLLLGGYLFYKTILAVLFVHIHTTHIHTLHIPLGVLLLKRIGMTRRAHNDWSTLPNRITSQEIEDNLMKLLVKHSPGTDMVAQCPVTPWPENINSEGSREEENLISKLNWFSLLI